MLPDGEDVNEWVAVNTAEFFNQITMLIGTLADHCTEESCPVMSAGPKYEYHWADGKHVQKPIKCSAPKYIDYLMTWIQDQIDDEALFPSKIGVPFPRNFISIAKLILKRLFRIYAHVYHQHFKEVKTELEMLIRRFLLSIPGCDARRGGSRQHQLEAFRVFCAGI